MALGGFMHLTGDGDRPPLRISMPQFYQHGSAAGAAGAMIAHTHRQLTGEGQHVDVSCQQAVARTLAHAPQYWDLEQTILRRMGAYRESAGGTFTRINWPCKDGYVNFQPGGGTAGRGSQRPLHAGLDGRRGNGQPRVGGGELGRAGLRHGSRGDHGADGVGRIAPFFMTHTRNELADGALERRILLFPVATPSDILAHRQLAARDYYDRIEHERHRRNGHVSGTFREGPDGSFAGRRETAGSAGWRAQPGNTCRGVGAERPRSRAPHRAWGDLSIYMDIQDERDNIIPILFIMYIHVS